MLQLDLTTPKGLSAMKSRRISRTAAFGSSCRLSAYLVGSALPLLLNGCSSYDHSPVRSESESESESSLPSAELAATESPSTTDTPAAQGTVEANAPSLVNGTPAAAPSEGQQVTELA